MEAKIESLQTQQQDMMETLSAVLTAVQEIQSAVKKWPAPGVQHSTVGVACAMKPWITICHCIDEPAYTHTRIVRRKEPS
eukprot:COSAG06_NODE_143_length_22242_cov_21.978323_2_plen_80_part_00